jgi:hypothetical protein
MNFSDWQVSSTIIHHPSLCPPPPSVPFHKPRNLLLRAVRKHATTFWHFATAQIFICLPKCNPGGAMHGLTADFFFRARSNRYTFMQIISPFVHISPGNLFSVYKSSNPSIQADWLEEAFTDWQSRSFYRHKRHLPVEYSPSRSRNIQFVKWIILLMSVI